MINTVLAIIIPFVSIYVGFYIGSSIFHVRILLLFATLVSYCLLLSNIFGCCMFFEGFYSLLGLRIILLCLSIYCWGFV